MIVDKKANFHIFRAMNKQLKKIEYAIIYDTRHTISVAKND